MIIFGNNSNTNYNGFENVPGIEPTEECLDRICLEASREVFQLQAASYISDVMMEEKVLTEGADPTVLLEGFASGLWTKIKNIFTNFKNKVLSWFSTMKKSVVMFFSSGKKFVEKFKNDILRKTDSGYEFKMYKYSESAGNTVITKIDNTVKTDVIKKYGDFDVKNYSGEDLGAGAAASGEKFDTSAEKEQVLKATGYGESMEEIKKKLMEAFRGGESQEEIKDFSGCASKTEMIKFIEEEQSTVKFLGEFETTISKEFNEIITSINKASNSLKGDDINKATPYVNHSTSMLNFGLNLQLAGYQAYTTIVKEMAKAYESVLKGYLRHKPVKEGFVGNNNIAGSGSSILESAFKYI